eukprot:scaffold18199_cov69-Phaeocystis_antarctica.AAC.1
MDVLKYTNTRRHGLHQSVCAKRSKPHPALAPDMQSGHRVGGSATLAWPPLSLEQPLAESALRQVLLLDDVNHRLSRRVEERRSTGGGGVLRSHTPGCASRPREGGRAASE